jgi:hypothetical protein
MTTPTRVHKQVIVMVNKQLADNGVALLLMEYYERGTGVLIIDDENRADAIIATLPEEVRECIIRMKPVNPS